MATVIDKLVVELGLDPRQFTEGQKKAAESIVKTRDQVLKSTKEIEASTAKTSEAVGRLTTSFLGLFAVFLSVRGVKELVTGLTSVDAALGRFAKNMNETPQTVSAWQMAAERMGGTAEATAGAIARIGQSLYDLRNNGQLLPKEFAQLQALTNMNIDPYSGINKFLQDTAAALQKLNSIDPSKVHFIAKGLGIDDATANVMIKYGSAINDHIESLKKLAPDNNAIIASQKLQETWAALSQTATSLGNKILEVLGPQFTNILKQMDEWLGKNREWLQSGITEGVEAFAETLKAVDWNAVGSGLKVMAEAASGLASILVDIVSSIKQIVEWTTGGLNSTLGTLQDMGIVPREDPMAGKRLDFSQPMDSPYNAKIWQDKENKARYSDLSRDPSLHGEKLNEETKVNGAPVSMNNPMPVTISKTPSGNGGGFWDSVGNAITSFFGGPAAASPMSSAARTGGPSDRSTKTFGGPAGVPHDARGFLDTTGMQQREYDAFREGLTDIEGKKYNVMGGFKGRYAGRYQMGPAEITETAKRLGVPRPSTADFLADPQMQERFMENYTTDHYNQLMKSPKFAAMSNKEKLQMLGYAHNQGVGGALKYLRTGQAGTDGWGTSGTAYFKPIGRRYDASTNPDLGVATGAKGISAVASAGSINTTTNSASVAANIGTINVHAPNATDANGVAAGLAGGIKNSLPVLANFGMR